MVPTRWQAIAWTYNDSFNIHKDSEEQKHDIYF